MIPALERYFEFQAHGANWRTEILAGFTTFMTMAYIIFVNPSILKEAGMPVGAVAGPRRLLEQLAPLGPVYQAGTLSGNPVAMAAGRATLERLRDGSVYTRLESLGRVLDGGLERAAAGIDWLQWRRVGSIFWLYLAEGEIPRRADAIRPEAGERYRRLHAGLLERGYYLAPSAYEVAFISAAHAEEEISGLAQAVGETAREMSR